VPIHDLYGRGYSDRVTGARDAEFFVKQFEDPPTDRGIDEEIALLGYSMGGAIATATAFAARHPGRIRRRILLTSAGMGDNAGREVDLPSERIRDWRLAGAGALPVPLPARRRTGSKRPERGSQHRGSPTGRA